MVATANAVKLVGAEVGFVDIHPDNLCMDFNRMREAVSERTKAIILVTINGRYPENLKQFVDFCDEYGLKLVEDTDSMGISASDA